MSNIYLVTSTVLLMVLHNKQTACLRCVWPTTCMVVQAKKKAARAEAKAQQQQEQREHAAAAAKAPKKLDGGSAKALAARGGRTDTGAFPYNP